ncbi:hypothetical protein PsYK624_164280 [Phanerochaete sordida]|uniref:Uncharacterized protein n=1 Tax=Phanerochaete sordida TaxID=48140 RepID=A0A9P3GS94_9APHY|nr:hypothetical protein PsYK624_164280 [Phanerochaete sordida]
MANALVARASVEKFEWSGSITDAFKRVAGSKVTYATRPHTLTQSRAWHVRWVSENLRPFEIVEDHAYQMLMKTSRPEYKIMSAKMLAHDVCRVFVNAR